MAARGKAKKSAGKGRGSKKAKRSGPRIDWAQVRSYAIPSAYVIGAAAVIVGSVFGLSLVRDRAAEVLLVSAETGEIALPEVVLNWPLIDPKNPKAGTWLPESDQAELLRVAQNAIGTPDPLSRRPLSAVGRALGQTGWLRSMPKVRRDDVGRIVVTAEWRRPLGVVRYGGRDHLVSWEGRLMPPVYAPGTSGQPVLLGVTGVPASPGPARYEQLLEHSDPHAASGLALLRVLVAQPYAEQVAGVDVSPLALASGRVGAGMIEIVTTHGTRVVWGSAPGSFRPGEQADDVKLARLAELNRQYGRIDGRASRLEIFGSVVEIDRRSP